MSNSVPTNHDPHGVYLIMTQDETKVQIPCPECKHVLVCDRELLGTTGQCKNCQSIFLITQSPLDRAFARADTEASYTFTCPHCQQLFAGRKDMQGRPGKCNGCGEVFEIALKKASNSSHSASQVSESEPPSPGDASPQQPNSSIAADTAGAPNTAGALDTGNTSSTTGPSEKGGALYFEVQCGCCDGTMSVIEDWVGTVVACPHCDSHLVVPQVV